MATDKQYMPPQLQLRLKDWGSFKGKQDSGVFQRPLTYKPLRSFNYIFALIINTFSADESYFGHG